MFLTHARNREEAASTVMGKDMYIMGGFVNGERVSSSEKTDKDNEASWVVGPEMPLSLIHI